MEAAEPSLAFHMLKQPHISWLSKCGMEAVGVRVATDDDVQASVWRGNLSQRLEAPVLALVTTRQPSPTIYHEVWYAGIVDAETVQLAEACYEAVEYGPHTLGKTLDLLIQFVPPDHYTSA